MKNSIIRRYYGCLSTAAEKVQKHRADSDNKVGAVKVHCKYKAKGQKAIIKPKSTYKKHTRTSNTFKAKSCRYCGKIHGKGQCLAYGKICSSCGKSNHFAAVCLTSKRGKVVHVENHSESTYSEGNEFFIGSVIVETTTDTSEFDIGMNSNKDSIDQDKVCDK